MLFIKNKDIPGVVGKIGTILGKEKINILGYLLSKVEEIEIPQAFLILLNPRISRETLCLNTQEKRY